MTQSLPDQSGARCTSFTGLRLNLWAAGVLEQVTRLAGRMREQIATTEPIPGRVEMRGLENVIGENRVGGVPLPVPDHNSACRICGGERVISHGPKSCSPCPSCCWPSGRSKSATPDESQRGMEGS